MKYNVVRGTRDIFGKTADYFNFVEHQAKKIFKVFGYEEIRTPIFEQSEVFLRSLGENTDIVSKEMYIFEDKGGRVVALRPEGTAPIVRAVIENNLINQEQDKRFYYLGPMFRYDRPQAGRYRQFYQIGAEIFGNKNTILDFEIIQMADSIIKNIGIVDAKLCINSVGCANCRTKYTDILQKYLNDKQNFLCETCNERKTKNVLRVFDCKIDFCKEQLKNAPKIFDYLCDDCRADFEKLQDFLTKQNIEFFVDKMLVRGLDYYTGMVFEILTDKLGAQSAICAGGRYDDLVEDLGGKNIPAVGFALGIDRIVEILKIQENKIEKEKSVFFITTNQENHINQIMENFDIIQKFREMGIIVYYNSVGKSIKSQMRSANDLNVDKVIFIEQNGSFTLKNMKDGEQVVCEKDKIIWGV